MLKKDRKPNSKREDDGHRVEMNLREIKLSTFIAAFKIVIVMTCRVCAILTLVILIF